MPSPEIQTADKATTRLVLWTLASASTALSIEEIATQVAVTSRIEIEKSLKALTDAGVLVYRLSRWAVSADLPGAGYWVDVAGDEAFVSLRDAEDSKGDFEWSSQQVFEAAERTIERASVWTGPNAEILAELHNIHDRLLKIVVGKSVPERMKAVSLLHTIQGLHQKHEEPAERAGRLLLFWEVIVELVPMPFIRLRAFLKKFFQPPRRPTKVDLAFAEAVMASHLKTAFDLIGPPTYASGAGGRDRV